MLARKAAQIFHDWAITEGLMSDSPELPASSLPELALVSPAMEVGKTILRQKRILAVGYNEAAREVIAYTKLAAPSGKKAMSALPSRVDDVKVRYRQGSHSVAGDVPPAPFGGPAYTVRSIVNGKKYTCGSSISVGNCVDAGTLGAIVKNAAGEFLGLSNNHVTASCSCADLGLPIVAPGLADVEANGLWPFTIGLHQAALPMLLGHPTVVSIAANTDAAVFKLVDASQISSFQGQAYDTPGTAAPLVAGMTVEKVGRTTGHTTGYVDSQLFGPAVVNYQAARYGFSGRIFFDNVYVVRGLTDVFSDNGDSGSLITTIVNGVRHAVGIVFAGCNDSKAPGGKITYALPIEPVLSALGVSLVSGHNI